MKDLKKDPELSPHIYLFDEMAERLGKNLQLAVIEGKIDAEDIVEGVIRCGTCKRADVCAAHIAEVLDSKEPFDFCQNKDWFSEL